MTNTTTHDVMVAQTEKAAQLLDYFQVHRDMLEEDREAHGNAMDVKLASVDSALHNHPILRQSPNQYGNLDANGNLDGWIKNGAYNITFTHVRDISAGAPYASRPAEDQAVLDAMGRTGAANFTPTIRVLRVDWSGAPSGANTWLMYPNQMWMGGPHYSMGSYARLLSGHCHSYIFGGITSEWGECGSGGGTAPGAYIHGHPFVTTESGSIEFFWPAVVQGAVKFDRNNPRWGYYASPYGAGNRDTSA